MIDMIDIVHTQLAIDLNCTKEDFNKDGYIFCLAKENIGRRPFPRSDRHFQMLTMGRAIIVSATCDILPYVEDQLKDKSRDEAFSMPFIYGHSMYYLPDINIITKIPFPHEFEYEMVHEKNIPSLYKIKGFNNAIQYDINHPRPDILVVLAKYNNNIVAMAGASRDCEKMWQIGIDVFSEFRGYGLAAALVNWLSLEIINKNIVPYYSTASSNIPSQRVAHRAGLKPTWMCCYMGKFDGKFTKPTN